MGDKQQYRINVKIRRRGETALHLHHLEIKSEDYNSDEEFSLAAAEQILELIREDREYLNEMGDV